MPDEPVRRKRRPQRRDQILAAALHLFHEHGYHATGMDEIGTAAGITGPGIYRHFRNKEEILETLVRDQGLAVVERAEQILAAPEAPAEVLQALVRSYVEGIVENPSLAVVAMYERHTLSDETRAWIDRMERRNIEAWVGLVRTVRPELAEPEARVIVHAALTLGVAVANYNSGLDDATLARILHPMVMTAVLGAPPKAGRRRSRPAASAAS